MKSRTDIIQRYGLKLLI